jgi:hypothetical protein
MSTNSIAAGMMTVVLAIFCKHFEPRVRHGDDADVRVNGAKGIIRRLGLARARDGVEQGGFAHVGQSDDSGFKHK